VELDVRSHWSDEDNAWLVEAVGIPGTRTHADTETEARDAAQELAAEVAEIMREAASLTLDEFARWMDLDERQIAALAVASPNPDELRSLPEWSRLSRASTAT
jgi:predicted RNase H-like HicB family nuclease